MVATWYASLIWYHSRSEAVAATTHWFLDGTDHWIPFDDAVLDASLTISFAEADDHGCMNISSAMTFGHENPDKASTLIGNLFISGFSLFMGLSVPAYFAARASADALGPGQTLALYTPTVEGLMAAMPSTFGGIVGSIGSTGMAVAAILGLLLDNLIPGSPEERGLGPSLLVPEGGDIGVGDE